MANGRDRSTGWILLAAAGLAAVLVAGCSQQETATAPVEEETEATAQTAEAPEPAGSTTAPQPAAPPPPPDKAPAAGNGNGSIASGKRIDPRDLAGAREPTEETDTTADLPGSATRPSSVPPVPRDRAPETETAAPAPAPAQPEPVITSRESEAAVEEEQFEVRRAPSAGPLARTRGLVLQEDNGFIVPVHFATDRRDTQNPDHNARFLGEFHGGPLTYGIVNVSIPDTHRQGVVERPANWIIFEWPEDPREHVMLRSFDLLDRDAFFRSVLNGINSTDGRAAMLFIHGFNVTFAEAARRSAQMAFDLFNLRAAEGQPAELTALPIMYSWPSQGGGSPTDYFRDAELAQLTVPHLREFLRELADLSDIDRIFVVAHSMGTRPLIQALEDIALERRAVANAKPLFSQVIFAAADMNPEQFRSLAYAVRETAEGSTLYASKGDLALKLAQTANGFPRAGDTSSGVTVAEGIDTVDASAVDTSFIGHSAYGSSCSVLLDIREIMERGLPADQRNWLKYAGSASPNGASPYWEFTPELVPDRLCP